MTSVVVSHLRIVVTCAAALITGFASIAHAVTSDVTVQVLDQFDTFSSLKAKRSSTTPVVFEDLNSTGATGFRSCQNGRNGLTCLDGQLARQFRLPKVLPATPASDPGRVLFSCLDDAMELDRTAGCQALTVDVGGDVWIAAKKRNSYNLLELRRNRTGGICPDAGTPLAGKVNKQTLTDTDSAFYCAYTRRTNRGLMADISAFDGELSARWAGGRGIIAVEGGKAVVFFPSDGSGVQVLGDGKSAWSLSGNEALLTATLLQREVVNASPPSTVYTYAIATSTTGRVLWRNAAATVAARQVADLNALGTEAAAPTVNVATGIVSFPRGDLCEAGSVVNTFDVRASDTTGRLYMSNRNYCKTLITSPVFAGADIASGTGNEKYSTSATFKPEGISVSPGIAVDLTECATTDGCSFLPDSTDPEGENTYAAARMTQVMLAPNSPANMTVFQIRNIPDCRYLTAAVAPACDTDGNGTIETADGVWKDGARGRYLNLTPLLPQQVKDLFDTSGVAPTGLPPLYVSPRYRAQDEQGFFFEALFGVADPNVQFRGEFTLDLDIGDDNLAGDKLGCGMFDKTPGTVPEPDVFNAWDILTVVSERFANVGGPNDDVIGADADHVDMLSNKDCFNPTAGAGTRWSMYSYNLELADPAGAELTQADAVIYLGEMVKELFLDLRAVQDRLVCENRDEIGNTGTLPPSAPLSGSACAPNGGLTAAWNNTFDKAVKCIDATYNPKSSALDQNCQSFDSQWDPYYTYVQSLSPTGVDPANRVGELKSRLDVIRHVFYDQFKGAAAAQAAP